MADITIRKTTEADLDEVMEIYHKARQFMRRHNNPTQWLGGKPDIATVRQDIAKGDSYVCIKDEKIAGVLCFFVGEDPTYKEIYGGSWLSGEEYGVVHRIASSGEFRGVGSFMMQWAFSRHGNIRVDTHEDNYVMQNMLTKLGYSYCGIIHLSDGSPRMAYQKIS